MTYSSIGVSIPTDTRPVNGFMQPANGSNSSITLDPMATKRRKIAGFMREVVAQNVRHLVDRHYADSDNKPKRLAEDAQISLSSAQRVLAADVGASIDTLESIANVFELSVYQLVLPNLDVDNPQVVSGASSTERSMYARFKRGQATIEAAKAAPANDDGGGARARVTLLLRNAEACRDGSK